MITVKRDNTKVVIAVDTDLAYDCKSEVTTLLSFEWVVPRPYLADVLFRYIKELIRNRMKAIRQEAYEQGWKDAKARRAKQDWFSGEL